MIVRMFLVLLTGVAVSTASISAFAVNLLKDVDRDRAFRIADHNGSDFQRATYLAKNHKIVEVLDAKSITDAKEITLKLFDEYNEVTLKHTRTKSGPGYVRWTGSVDYGGETPFKDVTLAIHSYDVSPEGTPSRTRANQYKFSERWEIDEEMSPRLTTTGSKVPHATVGPAPKTQEERVEHKRLKELTREVFFSVSANFQIFDKQYKELKRYVIRPLKASPRFSVLIEVDPGKVLPNSIDQTAGEKVDYSVSELEKLNDYQSFKNSLSVEEIRSLEDIK